ncbi:MAG: hypothetical protein ACXWQO_08535 [Bdellovibrionota bacterium]
MYKMILPTITMLLVIAGQAQAHAAKLTAQCNVSEIVSATGESKTTVFHFDGSLQTPKVELSLFPDVTVNLKGATGAVDIRSAFYLMAKIRDDAAGVTAINEGYFVAKQKYSDESELVVRGSLITHLIRKNGDKIEVACFNPRR